MAILAEPTQPSEQTSPAPVGRAGGGPLVWVQRHREFASALVFLLIMFGAFAIASPGVFLKPTIYAAIFVKPLVWISTRVLWNAVDEGAIDGSVNGLADGAQAVGGRLRRVESGNTRSYAAWVVVGAILFIAMVLWPTLRPPQGMGN